MSLMRPVIRICAVQALRGNTWAESRVYDTDMTPLVDVLTQDDMALPYITVYTDEDSRTQIAGRDYYLAPRSLALVLEMGLAGAITKTIGDGQQVRQIQIPATNEGLEFSVDALESQAIAALIGNPMNPWAELLRRMILSVNRVPSRRGGSAERGTRWAARQVVLYCDVLSDAAPGTVYPEDHPIRDFLELCQAWSPSMGTVATLVSNLINETAAPDWRQAQAWLTLTKREVRAMGIAPIVWADETAATLAKVTLDDTDRSVSVTTDDEPYQEPDSP